MSDIAVRVKKIIIDNLGVEVTRFLIERASPTISVQIHLK
jgi:23S rRNA G2445 N2-methylase RlmL